MKFQGKLLLLFCLFSQQLLLPGCTGLQSGIASFDDPAAITRVTHSSIRIKKVSISFFLCIAVVLGRTNVKTKKLQVQINTVKHI